VKEKFRMAHPQGVFVDRPIDNPIINDQSTVHERHEERRIIILNKYRFFCTSTMLKLVEVQKNSEGFVRDLQGREG